MEKHPLRADGGVDYCKLIFILTHKSKRIKLIDEEAFMSDDTFNKKKGKWEKFAEDQHEEQAVDESVSVDKQEEESEIASDGVNVNDGSELHVEELSNDMGGSSDLQNKIQALELQMVGFKDQAARAMAEVDNMRRRAERDVSHAHRYGNEKLMADLLPVIDSMVRAQEGVDDSDAAVKPMLDGVVMTLELLEKTLAKFGLNVIAPEKGEAFNPECHEAMSMLPDPDLEKNSVIQVLQTGYELNGRVLRAAMVIVAQ